MKHLTTISNIATGILLFLFSTAPAVFAQKPGEASRKWADSVYEKLSPRERLGQLFMVAAYSNKGKEHQAEMENLIRNYGIGGLCFFQGGPFRQANLTNRYQAMARVPLMIGMDAEWGLAMRLDSTLSYPYQMTLGAVQDPSMIEAMGKSIARQCRRLGVNVSFSPAVDINSNPANPVIGFRSFGEEKEAVTIRAAAYARGLQAEGVLAVAKHFPGHGDADTDSHLALPLIKRSAEEIRNVELYPYRRMKDSVGGIMIAHLSIPALDPRENVPTSISKVIVSDLLRKEIGYEGLIFTDALNMKGLSKFFKPGEADLQALLAGNDVLLFPEDVPNAIKNMEEAIKNKKLSWPEVEVHVKRILAWKHKLGLYYPQEISLKNLYQDLNKREDKLLIRKLFAASLTLARNENKLIPIRKLDSTRFASVLIGQDDPKNTFQKGLSLYAPFQHYRISEKAGPERFQEVLKSIRADVVVIAFGKLSNSVSKNFGIDAKMKDFVRSLNEKAKVISVHFGNAYSTGEMESCPAVISAFQWNEYTQSLAPELIFGAITATGRMPVSAGKTIKSGTGYTGMQLQRLRSAEPEEIGARLEILARIDSLAGNIISRKATPGCQILAAKDGAVFYNKCFGNHTYDSSTAVNHETLYDLASVTKVAATLQVIMHLQESGKIRLDARASEYLPELKGSNKENILVSNLLTHQAGLVAFIPHWKKTIQSKEVQETFYCDVRDDHWFCSEVVPGMYSMRSMEDSLWQWTIQSDLLPANSSGGYDFKYSDLSFYILKMLAERVVQEPLADFLERKFYQPLGLERLCFLPKRFFAEEVIAPTVKDDVFRKTQIRGNVHDEGAAMSGGIAGHAGLFANSWSLATLMQMNLNNGTYGGETYFRPETLPLFYSRPDAGNHRGLGWDKPYRGGKEGPVSVMASQETFGHTGFTGTCTWADPGNGLLFVFLSNRVYPDADNNRLARERVRPRIQDLLYKALAKAEPGEN